MQYKNKNIQHESDFGQITYISIFGYSINPKRSIEHIVGLLHGICEYPEEWYCDHNIENKDSSKSVTKYIPGGPDKTQKEVFDNTIIHNGFINNITYGPIAMLFNKNNNKYEVYNEFKNVIDEDVEYGFVAFDSGYIVLRFLNNKNPIRISLDICSYKKIDLDLLIDHLRAPSEKQDGLGMFDISYNIFTKQINENVLSLTSENRNEQRKEEFDSTKMICLYCDSVAVHWDIAASKSVPVCSNHFENNKLPYREIKYYGGTIYESES